MLKRIGEKRINNQKVKLSNIEILRFISILLVILHHVAIHTNWTIGLSTNFEFARDGMILSGKVGVDLFIIISGYLMINSRAKLTSLVRTVSETIVFSIFMYIVAIVLKINGTVFSTAYFFKRLFPVIFSDYWFVTAYVFMYILLPIVLPFLSKLTKKDYQRFLIIGFLVVSIWPMIALNKGMNFSYVILFLYLFAIGGYIRKYGLRINAIVASIAVILLTASAVLITYAIRMILHAPHNTLYQLFSFLGWSGPNSWGENIIIWFDASPFPIVIAAFIFIGVISMKQYYNNIVNFFGSHVFGAYLFQSAPIFSPWIYVTIINVNRINGTLNRLVFSLGVAILFVFIGIVLHVILEPIANKLSGFLLKIINELSTQCNEFRNSNLGFINLLGPTIIKIIFSIITAVFAVPGNKVLEIIIVSAILMAMMRSHHIKIGKKLKSINWSVGIIGGALYIVTFLPANYFNTSLISHIGLVLISFGTFSFAIANMLNQLKNEQNQNGEHLGFYDSYWKYILLYSTVIFIYFIAYYPGIMVVDSVNQWNQIHHAYPWNNWHPIGHTAVLWLTSKIWDNPASFVILQSIVYVTLFSYFATLLKQYSGKKWVGYLFFVLTAIVPFFPLQAMILVKDTLFTYAFVFFGLALFQTVRTHGQWLHKPLAFVFTLLSVMGISLWRSNGIPIVIVMCLLTIIILGIKKYWRLIIIMVIAIISYFVINGPIITNFHVFEPSKTESYGMLIQVDAGIIHDKGSLNLQQQQYFSKLMNNKNIASYQPTNIDAIKFGPGFDAKLLNNDTGKFKKESISLIKSNKIKALKAYKAQTAILWNQNAKYRIGTFIRDKYSSFVPVSYFLTGSDIEKYNIKYQMFRYDSYWGGFSKLHLILGNWQAMFKNQSVQYWFLPGIYLMMQVIIAGWLVAQGMWRKLLVILPIIGLAATYMLAIPVPDIRYVQPILLYVFITILVVKMPNNTVDGSEIKH